MSHAGQLFTVTTNETAMQRNIYVARKYRLMGRIRPEVGHASVAAVVTTTTTTTTTTTITTTCKANFTLF